MIPRPRAIVLLVAFAATACSSVPSRDANERLADAPAGNDDTATTRTLDLLDGRLTVSVPSGAASSPRQVSIMAAPVASQAETRVLLEPGEGDSARFVMVATELYLLGTGDVVADASKLTAKGEHASKLEGSAIPAAKIDPGDEPPGDHPIFLLSTVVAHPDGTLQEIEFYILPDMRAERARYSEKALTIAKTLAAGTRALDLSARTVDVGEALKVDVPKGYLFTQQPGPDFDVYWLRKLVHPGEHGATIGMYVGDHPSFQYQQADLSAKPATTPGNLLGAATTWYTWTTIEGVKTREAMSPLKDGRTLHAFAFGADDATLTELGTIADSIRAH